MLGNAFNQGSQCHTTSMLALMVNPFFGAPTFVARLIPVHKLDANFLYEQIIQLM